NGQLDLDALVQEGQLAQAFGEDLALELERLGEDLGVGPESDEGAGLRGRLALRELLRGLAPREGLRPGEALPLDLDLEFLGQGVHDRDAHAVETPGDLVAPAPELPSGVQDRQD